MPELPDWRDSWKKRAQVSLISGLGYPLLATLGSTYRYSVDGAEHLRAAEAPGPSDSRVLARTHSTGDHLFQAARHCRHHQRELRRRMDRADHPEVRLRHGARLELARRAARTAADDARRQDKPVAFTLDGPRGPARVAQPGAVWLSKATGQPVIPFHFESDRHWTMRSWDRTQIPKPRAQVALVFAEPFVVPRDATDGELGRVVAAPGTRTRRL